jgi:acyl-CoA thioesterase-1
MHRTMTYFLVGLLLCAASVASAQEKAKAKAKTKRAPNPAFRKVEDVAGLPRVLLIGDSISIGYTAAVQKLLKGKANVHRAPTNCGPTTRGLQQLDQWLGDKSWDVIHFNWGLHDLKYMGPDGKNLADPKAATSKPQVPMDDYEKNLRTLVAKLKKTSAKLIWCATTPVPEGAKGRVVGDSVKYNKLAAAVMKENDVAIDDLYSFAKPRLKEIQKPKDVHFTPAGSAELAGEVVKHIQAALGSTQ